MNQSGLDRIKRAFERGETELMISSFPNTLCSDDGRAIIDAGAPPINQPGMEAAAKNEAAPECQMTLPATFRQIYDFWKDSLKSGGFKFGAHFTAYPGGNSADVGLFFSWPKSTLDEG
jgi:hypothetical protein